MANFFFVMLQIEIAAGNLIFEKLRICKDFRFVVVGSGSFQEDELFVALVF